MATWGVGLMLLLSAGPVWASMERILGRSIPRLRYSPEVKRNRVYVAVPMVMGVVRLVATAACHGASDGCGGSSVALGMALAALVGWVVFGLLECCEGVARRVWRHFG